MCVNDMAACGATPLFFLDYFASSKLELKETATIIKGIAKACKKTNMALLGGETAEMPGHYTRGNFDLAGWVSNFYGGNKVKGLLTVTSNKQRQQVNLGNFSSDSLIYLRLESGARIQGHGGNGGHGGDD